MSPKTILATCFLATLPFAAQASAQPTAGVSLAPAPLDWGPVPIWWWSGDPLDLDRLVWQLDRMKQGGLRNAVLLNLAPSGPGVGSDADDPPFFSERWWGVLEAVLAEARKRDLHVWLYDQLGFANAGLQQKVVQRDPTAYAGWTLGAVESDTSGGPVHLALPQGATPVFAAAYPVREGVLACRQAVALPVGVTDRGLDWQAPPGRWKVMLFHARRGGFDYLSKAACTRLLDDVHGEYERRVGRYLGNVVPGTFQDELPPHSNWTGDFPERFRERHGYNLRAFLAALFHNIGPQTAKVRCDYFDTAAELAEQAFYRPLKAWHDKFGMICGMDQCCRDGDPINGQACYLDYFRTQRWFAAPGNDQNGNSKVNSSLAHLYDRPRVWQEGYYNSGWGQTLEDLLALINGSYVEGGTLYNPHAWYYSTRGSWWEWAPPCTSFRQPYWEHYPVLAGYVSRLSYLLSQGEHVCDVAVLYPSRTVQAETSLRDGPSDEARGTDRAFWEVVRGVRAAGYDLDVVDEESLQRSGGLDIAGESYRCLILPRARTIGRGTAEVIAKLPPDRVVVAYQGCPVATTERGLEPGPLTPTAQPADTMADLLALLGRLSAPDVQPAMAYLHRRARAADLARLGPESDAQAAPRPGPVDVYFLPHVTPGQTVTFRARGVPELWDLYAGAVVRQLAWRPVSQTGQELTEVRLEWEGGPGTVVVFRPGESGTAVLSRTNLRLTTQVAVRGDSVGVRGWAEGGGKAYAAAEVAGVSYYAQADVACPEPLALEGEWECRLYPTMDNRWGDFDLPGRPGLLPVDCRRFRYRQEGADEDGLALGWHRPDFADSSWEQVTYSVGPRCLVTGPLPPTTDEQRPSGPWTPYSFSTRFGIEDDPVFASVLGPKGHVSPEFLDLGEAEPGTVRYVRTWLVSPTDQDVQLNVGAQSPKTVWLNGEEMDTPQGATSSLALPVSLRKGPNEFLLRLEHAQDQALRAYFYCTKRTGRAPQAEWIWHGDLGTRVGQCSFRKTFSLDSVPAKATVWITADNGYELIVNGARLGSEEGAGTEVWQGAERYDVRRVLRPGENVIAVRATNLGGPAGLLVVVRMDDQDVVTDGSWLTSLTAGKGWELPDAEGAGWEPALVVGPLGCEPWGSIAEMPGGPRRGPTLPDAFWLEREPRPDDFVVVGYDIAPGSGKRVGWYRLVMPPGATEMRLHLRGRATAHVDGRELPVRGGPVALPGGRGRGPRVAVLRIEQEPGELAGAPFRRPVTFTCAEGRIPVGSWHELGLQNYSGGLIYRRRIALPTVFAGNRVLLDLGYVRGTAEVTVNGRRVGLRIASPYRFDLTDALRDGDNDLQVKVLGTLGPHYRIANPTPYVFPGQEVTGILGPVRLVAQVPVELRLRPHSGPEPGSARRLVNWALPEHGARARTSSELLPGFPAASVLTDDTSGRNWEHRGGWNDATPGVFPDWLEVDLGRPREVLRIVVATHPQAHRFGIREFDIACREGDGWRTLVTEHSNYRAVNEYEVGPLRTDAVRVTVHASHDAGPSAYSRVVAVRVLGPE